MSSSLQLDSWARQNRVRGWLGVFASDTLPNHVPQTPWSLVVNYQRHTQPGDHWVAAMGSHNRAFWFSSFGLQPDEADGILGDKTQFRKWLRRIAPLGWRYNTIQLQSLQGDECGRYAVYACKYRGGPMEASASYPWVSGDLERNDSMVKRLVQLPTARK